MESTKFPKRPTLRWDQYKRQVLCCLYRFFMCDKKETEEIFSYMFRGHLNERGIQGFVPFATLNTQWVWMKNIRDPVWSHVHLNTAFETDGKWKEILTKIKFAAETLRFQLREKTEDDTTTSHWSSLGPDSERSVVSDEPATPMLRHTLSAPETLNPMVLLFPTRDHVFGEISRANQSIDESMDQSVNQTVYQQNDLHNNIPNALHGSTEPVVTSDGKLCLWFDHEGTSYEFEDTQELQDEDCDYDSGYEDTSYANQHNDRQEDPSMREHTQAFKQSMRGHVVTLNKQTILEEMEWHHSISWNWLHGGLTPKWQSHGANWSITDRNQTAPKEYHMRYLSGNPYSQLLSKT
ncbi:hypothetical protein N7517_007953 [Penicillium concentricum]|uniref:Uncharacterized protein n=1 Tax=Penicillium concentricum TaxID=293559 RepID=A0A9W9V176_9EURO|nr:uncharacterized protein N7517_007953 [Penicillium concentricum]KAJ5365067.1 hypothetical protein N7517_007953 [Penicillium concentricum]